MPEPEVIQESEVILELEVRERKLWSGKKVSISAGSSKLVKVRIEGDWRGGGFVESMLPEEQDPGRKLVLPKPSIIYQARNWFSLWRTKLKRK